MVTPIEMPTVITTFTLSGISSNTLHCKFSGHFLCYQNWIIVCNEYIHGFDLPNTSQGLAGFWDADGDFAYDPLNGDYPIIEIRGCP